MLVFHEGLYYYDGPSLTVARMSPDLSTELVVLHGEICSPMAVLEKLYCAQPGKVIELGPNGKVEREFALAPHESVTNLAATREQLVWTTDTGKVQLAVDIADLANR